MRAYSLMYHDVIDGDADASGFAGADAAVYKLDRGRFERHLDAVTAAVERAGLERVTRPDELYRRAPSRPSVVLLHFDDGGASALPVADLLERRGWRGYFHITTDRIGALGFVTEADIRELDRRGHVIGSHSCSHPARMSSLAWADMVSEWSESLRRLADIVGRPVEVASVPGGYSSRRVIAAADRAGVSVLFTSEPVSGFEWIRGCLVLGRYAIKRTTPAGGAAALAVGERAPRWRQWAAWNGKKVLKRAGGARWLALRKRVLERGFGPR